MAGLVAGTGAPVTVVAHGFGASVAETRPLLSGVPGSKVLYEAHGSGYGELATLLADVADEHGATQALGVSMGAHTILRLLSHQPDRFTRVVLFLPASIDTPSVRRPELADALRRGDAPALEAWARSEADDDAYVRSRTAHLLASAHLADLLDSLDSPVPDRSALASVTADVLVLGQEGDPVHPASAARELVAVLPRAELHVFERPGPLWHDRARFRDLVVRHLSDIPPSG